MVSPKSDKIVPSFVIVLVVLFSFSVLIVSQPVAYGLPNVQVGTCEDVSFFGNFTGFNVSRGGSVFIPFKMASGLNESINLTLFLVNDSIPKNIRTYLDCKSQYLIIPPLGMVDTNITISASENTPLGDVLLWIGAKISSVHYTIAMTHGLNLKVTEQVDIPEFPSWASMVLAFAIPMVIVLVCQRKLTTARNRDNRNRD